MILVIIIIMATLVLGVIAGTIAHVHGSSRVPPRPRQKAPPPTQNVKPPKKNKTYI